MPRLLVWQDPRQQLTELVPVKKSGKAHQPGPTAHVLIRRKGSGLTDGMFLRASSALNDNTGGPVEVNVWYH